MDFETHNELETKSGISLDAMVTHAEMMRAFEAFKETSDQRLVLDQKRAGDVVVDEELARINAAVSRSPSASTRSRRNRRGRRSVAKATSCRAAPRSSTSRPSTIYGSRRRPRAAKPR